MKRGSAVFLCLQKLTEPDVPDAAEIDRELADELSEIADEMREDREQESGSESGSGAAGSQGPAYRYRVRYEEISDDPCQFCLDLLRELESFPVEEQQEAVPVFTEGIGALKAGAEMEDVKDGLERIRCVEGSNERFRGRDLKQRKRGNW